MVYIFLGMLMHGFQYWCVSVSLQWYFAFLRLKGIKAETIFRLTAIGAVQLGLMYCFYFQSFRFLTVPEVLLLVFTPIYITLLNDILSKQFHKGHLLTTLIAVLGAAYIQYSSISENVFLGFDARCQPLLCCWSSCLQVFIKIYTWIRKYT
jgi:drug/metabolite transporter (DMT)-like permease